VEGRWQRSGFLAQSHLKTASDTRSALDRRARVLTPALQDCQHGHGQVFDALGALGSKINRRLELAHVARTKCRYALHGRLPPLSCDGRVSAEDASCAKSPAWP